MFPHCRFRGHFCLKMNFTGIRVCGLPNGRYKLHDHDIAGKGRKFLSEYGLYAEP